MFKGASIISKGDVTHIAFVQLSPSTPFNFLLDERGVEHRLALKRTHKSSEEKREPFHDLGKLVALVRPQGIG